MLYLECSNCQRHGCRIPQTNIFTGTSNKDILLKSPEKAFFAKIKENRVKKI
jgi:hypothetical protein